MESYKRILLLEQSPSRSSFVYENLISNGFRVDLLVNINDLHTALIDTEYEFVVFNNTHQNGFTASISSEISRTCNDIPVVIYTKYLTKDLISFVENTPNFIAIKASPNDLQLIAEINRISRNKAFTILLLMKKNVTTANLERKLSSMGFLVIHEVNLINAEVFLSSATTNAIVIEPATFDGNYTDLLKKDNYRFSTYSTIILDQLTSKQLQDAFNNGINYVLPTSCSLDFLVEKIQNILYSGLKSNQSDFNQKEKTNNLYNSLEVAYELIETQNQAHASLINSVTNSPQYCISTSVNHIDTNPQSFMDSRCHEPCTKQNKELATIRLSLAEISKDFKSLFETLPALCKTNHHVKSDAIMFTGEHGVRLSNQMIDLLNKQSGTQYLPVEPFANISDTITNMKKLFASEELQIENNLDPSLNSIICSQTDFDQSMVSLFSSIGTVMPKGGCINISTTKIPNCKRSNDIGRADCISIEIKVQNNVEWPCNENSFNLSHIIRRISKANGSISIDNTSNFILTFTFIFSFANKLLVSKHNANNKKTILIAEDEPLIRMLTRKLLVKNGFNVISAKNGREAVQKFKQNNQNNQKIDMLVLDVLMPDMNGREAADAIKAIDPDIPILFCSGYAKELLPNDYLRKISATVLPKPFMPEELLNKVATILNY